jgi:calcium permeable stress-gated cation channel
VGAGVGVIVFVEAYSMWKTRLPGRDSLSPITRDSLRTFGITARTSRHTVDEEDISHISSARSPQGRSSMASVLDMMSLTLAVMPSTHQGPVPLRMHFIFSLSL